MVQEDKGRLPLITRLALYIPNLSNKGPLPPISSTGITVKTLIIHGDVGKIPQVSVEDQTHNGWLSLLEELIIQDVDLGWILPPIPRSPEHSDTFSPLSNLTTLICPAYTAINIVQEIPLPQLRKLTLLHSYLASGASNKNMSNFHVWVGILYKWKPLHLPRLTTLGFDFYPQWKSLLSLCDYPRRQGAFEVKEFMFPALPHPRILKELVFALGGQRSSANSPPGTLCEAYNAVEGEIAYLGCHYCFRSGWRCYEATTELFCNRHSLKQLVSITKDTPIDTYGRPYRFLICISNF